MLSSERGHCKALDSIDMFTEWMWCQCEIKKGTKNKEEFKGNSKRKMSKPIPWKNKKNRIELKQVQNSKIEICTKYFHPSDIPNTAHQFTIRTTTTTTKHSAAGKCVTRANTRAK